jgi:hypothetical protein
MDGPFASEWQPSFSRRDALKKAGVVAGVAWTAPVFLSLQTQAGATGSLPPKTSTTGETVPPHPECTGATCDTFVPCSSSNPDCICVKNAAGGGACVPGSTPCDSGPLCDRNLECPPGFFCAVDTCCTDDRGNPTPVCGPVELAAQCPPDDTLRVFGAQRRVRTGAAAWGG